MASSDVEAIDQSLRKNCGGSMDLETFLSELDLDGIPTKANMSLVSRNGKTCSVAVQKSALEASDIYPENAGTVDTYHYDRAGVVLIDLNSHKPEE